MAAVENRTVRGVLVTSGVKRETHALSYQHAFLVMGTLGGPPVINWRKEWTTVGPYAPNLLGLHAGYNGYGNGFLHRKVLVIS